MASVLSPPLFTDKTPRTMTLKKHSSQSLDTCNAQPQSPFLRLPAELRNTIYFLLLTQPHARALRSVSTRGHLSSYVLPSLNLHPAILRTCKQIHAEATPILYNHTFGAHSTLLTKLPFLVDPYKPVLCPPVDVDGRSLIRSWHILVRLDTDARFSSRQAAASFTGVDELEIEVWQAMFGAEGGFGVLKRFEGVRGVRKARVTGRVEHDLAEWLEKVMMQPLGTPPAALPEGRCWEREDEDEGIWTWGGR